MFCHYRVEVPRTSGKGNYRRPTGPSKRLRNTTILKNRAVPLIISELEDRGQDGEETVEI
jgi:hypothetical protein